MYTHEWIKNVKLKDKKDFKLILCSKKNIKYFIE